jgi:hypothetical protein
VSGAQYDAPNQQVVRGDGSGPADEGTGGSAAAPEPEAESEFDAMTKDELLDEAYARGIDVPSGATKAEIREAIEAG